MTRTSLLTTGMLLLGSAAAGAAEVPCYNCKTVDCPDLEAPVCSARPTKKKDAHRGPKAPAKAPEAESAGAVSPPPPGAPGGAGETPSPAVGETPKAAAKPPEEGAAPAITRLPEGVKAPDTAPPRADALPPPANHRLRSIGIGVGVGGLLLAGAGAALLAVDKRYGDMCTVPGEIRSCASVYSTTPFGAPLLAAGGAALVGATVLFVIDARRARGGETRVSARPALRGGWALR